MTDFMRINEAASLWEVTPRAVTGLCKAGKIPGAKKEGGIWLLPKDARRPLDHRFKSASRQKVRQQKKLPLPVGISDYRLASSSYYYVDKTLMIRDFLDERPMVSLFTRPRRFGKTLNMDMLRTFFEKTEEDTSIYFKNKKIWTCGSQYRAHQGKYPVIFLTFKDVKRDTWDETYEHISRLIQDEFQRHHFLLQSELCSTYDKKLYQEILEGTATATDLMSSLKLLSKMLHMHYKRAAIIIIDEYDTPIQQGYMKGFYEPVVSFMRNFFSAGLKDNHHLAYGFLTGILRVARESIFSGLNNLVVNSVLDRKYSEYFGFTKEEILEMAAYYQVPDKTEEICSWYDGYRFGNTEIFNPWSVINYFNNDCEARAYWVSTSNNDIISEILTQADASIYDQLSKLLQGESFLTYIDTSVIYPQIRNNPSSIYSFLLVSGYLKTTGKNQPFGAGSMCEVALPNKEIRFVYQNEILNLFSAMLPQTSVFGIQEALYSGDASALQEKLQLLLKTSVSFYDTAKESFYHGLLLGLLAIMDSHYKVLSNREAGEGRYDICLIPLEKQLPGIIIELKAAKKASPSELQQLAREAICQIAEKQYDLPLLETGVKEILKYGVAFCGKQVEVMLA